MKRENQRRLVVFAALAVWGLVLAASLGRFKLAARPPLTVSLKTKPAEVQIRIDNEPYEGGGYVTTPLELNLSPGRHRVKVSRKGYVSHVMTVEGDGHFNMHDVVLERNPNAAFVPVTITVAGPNADAGWPFAVEGGLVRGELPATFDELIADDDYVLEVFADGPDDEPFRCRFLLKSGQGPYELVLRETPGKGKIVRRLKSDGCRKLVKKK